MNDAVRDSLENIQASIILIQRRFIDIQTADQLLSDTDDLLTLDAVAMRLQIVGENEKVSRALPRNYCKDILKSNGTKLCAYAT